MSSEWILSVFTGKDLVPRLNWQNIKRLREQILDLIRRGKVNKNKILRSIGIKHPNPDVYLYTPEEVPQNENTDEIQAWIDQGMQDPEEFSALEQVQTYIAGRVLHFAKVWVCTTQAGYHYRFQVKTVTSRYFFIPVKHRTYEAYWIDRTSLDEILISSRMVLDHMPDIVVASIQDVWNRYDPEQI